MRPDLAVLPPRYLRTKEAAEFLSLSARTLEKHRTYGTGPAYRKLGGRVVYAVDDLEAWAERGAVTSTSDPRGSVLPAKRHTRPRRRHMPDDTRADRPRIPNGGATPVLSERGQLDLFRALPGEFAARDAQDLMAYPFFSSPNRTASRRSTSPPAMCRSASRPCPITAWRPFGTPTS